MLSKSYFSVSRRRKHERVEQPPLPPPTKVKEHERRYSSWARRDTRLQKVSTGEDEEYGGGGKISTPRNTPKTKRQKNSGIAVRSYSCSMSSIFPCLSCARDNGRVRTSCRWSKPLREGPGKPAGGHSRRGSTTESLSPRLHSSWGRPIRRIREPSAEERYRAWRTALRGTGPG